MCAWPATVTLKPSWSSPSILSAPLHCYLILRVICNKSPRNYGHGPAASFEVGVGSWIAAAILSLRWVEMKKRRASCSTLKRMICNVPYSAHQTSALRMSRPRLIVWRKLPLSSMFPHMCRWQLHLLSRCGIASHPHYFRFETYAKVAIYWHYIWILVGLKKNRVEFFALRRLCKDAGCHWRTLGAIKTLKLPEKPFWSTTNSTQSGLSVFLGWSFYHFLRYLKKVWPWICWKMQRYLCVEGPKEMAFSIECQFHIFHPEISRIKWRLFVYWDIWSSLPYPSDCNVHILAECQLRQIHGMALTSLIQGQFCFKFWLGAFDRDDCLLLCFCQIPVWCKGELPHPCGDPKEFALSGMPYIERWMSLLIEVCTLILMWSLWLINLQILLSTLAKSGIYFCESTSFLG